TLELRLDVMRRERRVLGETTPRLLDVPAEPVNACIGDQTAGAPHFVRIPSEALVRVPIYAHFLTEELRVQTPALDEGRRAGAAAEVRQILQFLRQRNLQMMAGRGFVHRERRKLV